MRDDGDVVPAAVVPREVLLDARAGRNHGTNPVAAIEPGLARRHRVAEEPLPQPRRDVRAAHRVAPGFEHNVCGGDVGGVRAPALNVYHVVRATDGCERRGECEHRGVCGPSHGGDEAEPHAVGHIGRGGGGIQRDAVLARQPRHQLHGVAPVSLTRVEVVHHEADVHGRLIEPV